MNKIFKGILDFLKKYYFLIFGVVTLILPDLVLRSLLQPGTFTERYVEVAEMAFTLTWIFIIIFLCVFLLPRRIGKVLFAIISGFFIIFSFSQYIYYKIFDQFFWLKSVTLAGEGAAYFIYAIKLIDAKLILYTLFTITSLVVVMVKWKSFSSRKFFPILLVPVAVLVLTHMCMQPEFHKESTDGWDTWRKPSLVYQKFNDINKSFEIAGLYQFTYLDIYTTVFPNENYDDEGFAKVNEYFALKGEPTINKYTGLFEGKNVIAVMMESIDTWMIDKKNTPTLYKMMKDGIHFTNYNAPFFGAGFTFGSEFAFNTGFFTPVSAVSASNFSNNSFPYALARLFKEKGYAVNSFHFNNSEFYNRGIMHKSFGYEKYNCFASFGLEGTEAELDSNILRNDEIYNKMTAKSPFFNFIITYSAHLPYAGEDAKLLLAKEYRPDLINEEINPEKNNIEILAADTDEFFRQLLERLEADGLLEDTVIVAYTDHFAYGVSDVELLNEWKGDELSYKVPAFIYAKGITSMKVSKPMMTIDWAPTLVNLFGLNRAGRYIGNDILDPDHAGFVYFETWEWLDDKMYYTNSEEVPSEDIVYIQKQNQRVKESIEINDIVVLGDYYKNDKSA